MRDRWDFAAQVPECCSVLIVTIGALRYTVVEAAQRPLHGSSMRDAATAC
jgi:hypothetical protein